jgi:hypothetical protein
MFQNLFIYFSVYLYNLKKATTILFVMFYLMASSGVLVGQHVCMGDIQETSLFSEVEVECPMSMHDTSSDCCENEWLFEKVDDSQHVSINLELADAEYNLLYEVAFNELVASLKITDAVTVVQNTGPPDITEPDLFILYHSLKIPFVIQS